MLQHINIKLHKQNIVVSSSFKSVRISNAKIDGLPKYTDINAVIFAISTFPAKQSSERPKGLVMLNQVLVSISRDNGAVLEPNIELPS